MAVLPRCIEILTNLFVDIPDDIYSIDDMRKNVVSSLYSIFNLFSRIASDPANENYFIFRSDVDVFVNSDKSLKSETISNMCNSLFDLTEKLSFEDNIDNDISKITCAYLRTILNDTPIDDSILTLLENNPYKEKIHKLANRLDRQAVMLYLFCQILFAHFYRKKYNEDLSIRFPTRLLFNSELDKYQFSLPYEDQVTGSYFVFRYIYLPEERERQYSDERNKYDCGFKPSKPMKYKYVEVKEIINDRTQPKRTGEKTTTYDNFADRMVNLNLIKSKKNKSKHYSLLKFYLLINTIKCRRDVVRSKKSDEKYGFNIIKMLESIDIENFVFDGLPYETANGYHSTILLSEIKKDVEFKDLVILTCYYIKTMKYLNAASDTIHNAVEKYFDSKPYTREKLISTFQEEIKIICDKKFSQLKITFDQAPVSDDVMLQALSLVYIQAIESCLLATNTALQYILDNMEVIAPEKNVGIFSDSHCNGGILFYEMESSYYSLCELIGNIFPELLPPEEEREKKFQNYYKIIKRFISESKTPSYNQGQCSSRFLISMILVCLLADQGKFAPIPQPSYYHSGKTTKQSTLYDLLSMQKYSILKHLLISNIFEAQNECLSGKIDNWKSNVRLLFLFNREIKDNFIPVLKSNPLIGLKLLYSNSEFLYMYFDAITYFPSPITGKEGTESETST